VFVRNFATIYDSCFFLVYNVHGLPHLADDARKFGALDNVSVFRFDNFLEHLKKKVRRAQNPIAQIVRRVVEMHKVKVTCSTSEFDARSQETYVKKIHNRGPSPGDICNCQQYQQYVRSDMVISCCDGDNCFDLLGRIGIIKKHRSEETQLTYEEFENIERFLNIFGFHFFRYLQSFHANISFASISCVSEKYILLPLKQGFVGFPLLHSK
jgi:hypothetical protein